MAAAKNKQQDLLFTLWGTILACPTVLHQEEGVIVLSVYQNKDLVNWLYEDRIGQFKYKNKMYTLRYLLLDIIEYDLPKIKKLFEPSIKGFIIPSERSFQNAVRQDALLGDEHGPKGIMLVLVESFPS